MAWTTPKTFSSSEVLDAAADLNVYERDNIKYLAEPETCSASGTSANVPHATWTSISLSTEHWDTDGIHSLVSNTEKFTIQSAGIYLATAYFTVSTTNTSVVDAGNATQRALLQIYDNSATTTHNTYQDFFVSGGYGSTRTGSTTVHSIREFGANDTILCGAYHLYGASEPDWEVTLTVARLRGPT